jgi:hypothetical protein
MNNFIVKNANRKNALILLGMVILINVLLVLSMVGNPDLKPLDLQLSYSPEKAYELISAYNEKDRFQYILVEITLDLIYPIVYALLFSFILFLLHKDAQIAKFPFLITILDLIENGGIVTMLASYPNELHGVASFTSIFTTLKWIAIGLTVILIFWGILKKWILK